MNLSAATDERNGVTLVELEVENPTRTTRRVRIRNELSSPVLPPRRHGSIVDGFDEEGITITIAAGARRAVGYACRAGAESPPATLVGSEPCDSTELDERSADDVLVALGDPRPPRDAITPEIRSPASGKSENKEHGRTGGTSDGQEDDAGLSRNVSEQRASTSQRPGSAEAAPRQSVDRTELGEGSGSDRRPSSNPCGNVPPAVDAWLSRASERIQSGDPVNAASLRAAADRADNLARRAGR